jgi:hypothetical protein
MSGPPFSTPAATGSSRVRTPLAADYVVLPMRPFGSRLIIACMAPAPEWLR